jgi:hypothetical protein
MRIRFEQRFEADNHRNHPELRHVSSLHYRLRHQSCPVRHQSCPVRHQSCPILAQDRAHGLGMGGFLYWSTKAVGYPDSSLKLIKGIWMPPICEQCAY